MKLKLTESQLNKLITEGSVTDRISIFYREVNSAKSKLNGLWNDLTSYSIQQVLSGEVSLNTFEDNSESINDYIYKAYKQIVNELQSVSQEDYDRLNYHEYESDVDTMKNKIDDKRMAIESLLYRLNNLKEPAHEGYDENYSDYFGDSGPIEV